MAEMKRVKVPCPLPGEAHKEKWIERRETIGIPIYQKLAKIGNYFTEEGALEEICKVFSELVVDWDLEDGEGNPLPKPYQNPDALMRLAEVDSDAFLWLNGVIQSPIDRLFEVPEEKS